MSYANRCSSAVSSAIVSVWIMSLMGCSADVHLEQLAATPPLVKPLIEIVGLSEQIMEAGERMELDIALQNNSESEIMLSSFKSSCPCVRFSELPTALAARATVPATLVVDHSAEPDFVGKVGVILTLRSESVVVGQGIFHLDVRPSSSKPLPLEGS
jgi:hypothetical protein